MLPAAASLKKQGANNGATTAFLISTPESGVDSIAISYALLDPIMTVIRPLAAFVTAIVAGFFENIFFWKHDPQTVQVDLSCPVDGCCDGLDCPTEVHRRHHSIKEKSMAGIRFGFSEVWGDIVGWFFVGLLLAALITTLVPEDLMVRLLGGGISSMLVMLVVGIPLYICATASTPVAAALILKGVSPGAALVFLLVGPATNITSLSVVGGFLGKRSALTYLTILSLCAVLFGLGLDALYGFLHISPRAIIGEAAELVPHGVKMVSAVLLVGLSLRPLWKLFRNRFMKKKEPAVFISDFPTMPDPLAKNSIIGSAVDGKKCGCDCGK